LHSDSSFVLDDLVALHALCGPQDENLRVLEELLGVPVYLRGNELHVSSPDIDCQNRFGSILREMERCHKENRLINPDIVRSAWQNMADGEDTVALLRKNSISIPQGLTKVFPRSASQAKFLEALDHHDMVFGIGPAGTGKTFLAIAHALSEVLAHRKHRLVLTRPVVEAGESLGFLPGDLEQKLNPYIKPLYDAMDALVPPEVIQRMEELRIIEIAPLAYMRGRSLRDSYIILDEAQNTTREQMKMFLTRLGEGSKAVITGDVTQTDLPVSKISGLVHAQRVLRNIPEIKMMYFGTKDVVRSRLVQKIIQAYEEHESPLEQATHSLGRI